MNKSIFVSALCLLLAVFLMAWGFRTPSDTPSGDARYYALMTEDLGTDVMQFKQGAQAAAKELGVGITFLTCARTGPLEEELATLLASLKSQSVDGVILPPLGASALDSALQLGVGVVCLFETDAPGVVSVVTDFESLGKQLGEAALMLDRSDYTVFMGDSTDETRMLAGLIDALGAPAKVYASDSPADVLESARVLPKGSVAFALNADLTLALASADLRLTLYGVDPGEARVDLLKSGAAEALAMQMPYAKGYQAVMALSKSASGGRVVTPSRVVTRDKMYLSENVKLMFPLLQ